jgi:hypothetical protein
MYFSSIYPEAVNYSCAAGDLLSRSRHSALKSPKNGTSIGYHRIILVGFTHRQAITPGTWDLESWDMSLSLLVVEEGRRLTHPFYIVLTAVTQFRFLFSFLSHSTSSISHHQPSRSICASFPILLALQR